MATCKGLKLVCISCQSLELGSLCCGWHKYKAAIKAWACSQSISSTDKSSGPNLLLLPIYSQPHSSPHFTGAVLGQWPLLSHHSCRLAELTLMACKNPLFSFSWALSLALAHLRRKHTLVAPRCIFKAQKPKGSGTVLREQTMQIDVSWFIAAREFGSGRQAVWWHCRGENADSEAHHVYYIQFWDASTVLLRGKRPAQAGASAVWNSSVSECLQPPAMVL